MARRHVRFVNLWAQYLSIREELDAAIAQVIAESAFIRGSFVERFERDMSAMFGVGHCVSCGNGTDAIFIALRALGLQPGDEVITTAHSWIATSETITQAGGRVVFVDTDGLTFTIDPALIEAKITPRTRGLIVVHLYGQSVDLEPILAIAARHHLWLIEDCAQAHGATYHGRKVGTFGAAATFSFYPGKNLGAMGDAGCILTNDDQVASFSRLFAQHGGKGVHEIEGMNSRLDGLQGAILSAKLPHLADWNLARRRIAARYDHLLQGIGDIEIPMQAQGREHVYVCTWFERIIAIDSVPSSLTAVSRRRSTIRERCRFSKPTIGWVTRLRTFRTPAQTNHGFYRSRSIRRWTARWITSSSK